MQLAHDIGRKYGSQAEYDSAQPAEDRPAPDLEGEIGDLMTGADSHLMSYKVFQDSADEYMYDLLPNASHTELLLAAMRSSDPVMRRMGKDAKEALEDHARAKLYAAWERQQRKGASHEY